jgi:4-amino-4-deoxy-L-arabinose transferase-like glycosyltransferase
MKLSTTDKILVAALIVFTMFSAFCINNYLSDAGDNAQYMILAKSLITFQGYKEISDPAMPDHVKLPPVFPLMLAPLVGLFGFNLPILKVFMLIISLATFISLYLLLKQYVKEYLALGVTCLTIFSFEIFHWSNDIMSEMPFMLFTFLALYYYKKENFWNMCVSVILACLTRTSGIVLAGAIVLSLLLRKEVKTAIKAAIVIAIPNAVWMIRNLLTGNPESYLKYLLYIDPYQPSLGFLPVMELVNRAATGMYFYFGEAPLFISTHRAIFETIPWLSTIIFGIVALGALILLIKKTDPTPIYILATFIFFYFWPWTTIRFLVPIAPFFILFFIMGIKSLIKMATKDKKAIRLILMAIMILLLVVQFPPFIDKFNQLRNPKAEESMALMEVVAKWSANNTNTTETFIVRKPYNYYIWSDRRSSSYPYTYDEKVMFDYLVSFDYVYVDSYSQTTNMFIEPIISSYPEVFVKDYGIEGGQLYKVSERAKQVYRNQTKVKN